MVAARLPRADRGRREERELLRDDFQFLKFVLLCIVALLGITVPGAALTAAIDGFVPLDAGQLWTFSILLSLGVVAALCAAFARAGRRDAVSEGLLSYGALVALLVVAAASLHFGAGIDGIGDFVGRFAPPATPESSPESRAAAAVAIVITSCMTVAGALVAAGSYAVSAGLSKPQIWLGGLGVYVVAGLAISRWGRRQRWDLFFVPDAAITFDPVSDTIIGMMMFLVVNVAAMVIGCVAFFGFKLAFLRPLFERFSVSA